MAPVVGDIGSCGQPEDELDPVLFFESKQAIDCDQCRTCLVTTHRCGAACNNPAPKQFPKGCVPLTHDGEVCLDALLEAGCTDYAAFMSDQAPAVPTECDFCPPRSK